MSKITKFYSLGIDILKATKEGRERAGYLDADMMDKTLCEVEVFFASKGQAYAESSNVQTGSISVNVTCDGKPILCEVRLYPYYSNDTFKTDYESTGRIDFLRFVADENGSVKASVPTGEYLLKVSKGSEYSIEYKRITVARDSENSFAVELSRLVDLSKENWFAGDLHHHSIYSSPVWGGTDAVVESCKEVADSMQASGLMFGALSDHHNIFNHKEWKSCETPDFHPIPSKEISTSNGHVLALGVDEYDVIYNIPDAKDRTEKYLRGEFVRITDEIREKGGLPQLNHPRDLSVSISWNRDFYDMTGIFETVEIWNGSNPMYYGSTDWMAAKFWRDLLEKGQFIPATTGSDTHNIKADDYHSLCAKIFWLKEKTEKLLASEDAEKFSDKKRILECFLYIVENYLPLLEVWAKTSLTSGCVRTYVNTDGERNTKNILNALRKGHSFLTNGPILTVSVNGASMGETAKVKDGKADISIRLLSNRKLEKLTAYTDKYREMDIPLKENSCGKLFDYSMKLDSFDIGDTGYIFFVASNGCTTLAITNPVLIEKE